MLLKRAAVMSVLAAGIGGAAAAEGEGGGAALITPQFGLFFWTAITFVALILFLRWYAWKPLLGAIQERERSIRESQEQARRDREEASGLLDQHRQMLGEARKERQDALEAGRRDAERLKTEMLEEARRHRDQTLKQTEAQVEALVRQAQAELRGTTADLAVQVASRLISKNLDDATQRRLVEEYLTELEARSGPSSTDLPS